MKNRRKSIIYDWRKMTPEQRQEIRLHAVVWTLFLLFLSCGCEKKPPVEPLPIPSIDIIGFEQTVRVGNYAVLEDTCNGTLNGEPIIRYEWSQDPTNPARVSLPSYLPLDNDVRKLTQPVGFVKEGVYRFTLVVSTQTQIDTIGTWQVTVFPQEESVFEDLNLEVKVRYTLKKPTDMLTRTDFLLLDTLVENCINTDRITSLNGIENCSNLLSLRMLRQNIIDLSPLTDLTKIVRLNLNCNGDITDVTPLSRLVNLKHLSLESNNIRDISCLENLTKLTYLWVGDTYINSIAVVVNMPDLEELWLRSNPIGSIDVLADLKKLKSIWLADCDISDISPLQNLTNLKVIGISFNQVTDILPLVNNTGLGAGDMVYLSNNPLNEKSINEYIPALEARGVTVSWW
ncbi:MAG: leucine-rich repeat domain-containing protein [Fidelibacterota bacterium]